MEPTAIGLATADGLLRELRHLLPPFIDEAVRVKTALGFDVAAAEMRRMAVSEILSVVREMRDGIVGAAKGRTSDPYWKGCAAAAKTIIDAVEKIAVGWAAP